MKNLPPTKYTHYVNRHFAVWFFTTFSTFNGQVQPGTSDVCLYLQAQPCQTRRLLCAGVYHACAHIQAMKTLSDELSPYFGGLH
jgi:hypothetical protein